jgi:hypothetical protein
MEESTRRVKGWYDVPHVSGWISGEGGSSRNGKKLLGVLKGGLYPGQACLRLVIRLSYYQLLTI